MRNLVVCCDGTWNDKNNQDDGTPAPTNVRRLFNALIEQPSQQLKRYQSGVGTEGLFDKLAGGLLGVGISADIMDCYYWLCDKYQLGDKIFLFGFSRGAFCARSLAGLVAKYGLLDLKQAPSGKALQWVKQLYEDGYRKGNNTTSSELNHLAFQIHSNTVEFIGVWDTVGALGVPDDKVILDLFDNPRKYRFHDVKLNDNIKHARHAIAIDEKRSSFTPTFWLDNNNHIVNNNQVKQMWFPGVHSDIGGGYKENGLSACTLKWMVEEANSTLDNKLLLPDNFIASLSSSTNDLDILHDSHVGVMKVLEPRPRFIPNLTHSPLVSEHAHTRQNDLLHCQAPYRPLIPFTNGRVQKDIYAKHPWNWTGIWLEEGKQYTFKASGLWSDASIECGPKGTKDGRFQAGEIVHVIGSLFGKMEGFWNSLTHKEKGDFFMTRRIEKLKNKSVPWFCLVGCIANATGQNHDGTPNYHEHFAIGEGCTFTPSASGYLYCFANDAWGFYSNNRNYVSLTIEEA